MYLHLNISHKASIYTFIMNHDSGFMIGIARKIYQNPNRMLTKLILKIALMVFNFDEKPLKVSFSVV